MIPVKLLKEYQKSIPEKLSVIENLIIQIEKNPNLDTLESLILIIHKCAGSAGTYGFSQASRICKEWEQFLLPYRKEKSLNSEFISTLKSFLNRLKESFCEQK